MDTFQDSCFCCGSKEDPYFDTINVSHRPPDAYVGLLAGIAMSVVAGGLGYSLASTESQYFLLRALGYIGWLIGYIYYVSRGTSATFNVVVCPSCRKKYVNRKLLRMAIIVSAILISLVGAVVVSAVMGKDDYTGVPLVAGGVILVAAFFFGLLSKPRLVEEGPEQSVINIPGIGRVRVDNSWSEADSR